LRGRQDDPGALQHPRPELAGEPGEPPLDPRPLVLADGARGFRSEEAPHGRLQADSTDPVGVIGQWAVGRPMMPTRGLGAAPFAASKVSAADATCKALPAIRDR